VAELVERAAWAKVEVVSADEREAAGRIALNLGHSLGHAVEAAVGYRDLRHGEAVALGLRAAARIGAALGVTPPERAARIERLLDGLGLATGPVPVALEAVLAALSTDKKHAAGRLRWVLPTATGHEVRDDVPDELVAQVAAGLLAPPPAPPLAGGPS
jgi:3-dehydroquinate synthase